MGAHQLPDVQRHVDLLRKVALGTVRGRRARSPSRYMCRATPRGQGRPWDTSACRTHCSKMQPVVARQVGACRLTPLPEEWIDAEFSNNRLCLFLASRDPVRRTCHHSRIGRSLLLLHHRHAGERGLSLSRAEHCNRSCRCQASIRLAHRRYRRSRTCKSPLRQTECRCDHHAR